MIQTFRDAEMRRFALGGRGRFTGLAERLARRRLAQLHAAATLADLDRLDAVRLHKLKGPRTFWSIDVNRPWRLLFEYRKGHAYEVHLHDPR